MLIVVTGGSGSGKSAFAEEQVLALGEGERFYIATMFPFDEESHRRIERHRRMRAGKGFQTIERYTGLSALDLPKESTVLLECMSNLTANEMFQENGAHEKTVDSVRKGIVHLNCSVKNLVVVTNEVFSDACTYSEETILYNRNLGEINRLMAEMADVVVEVVYGIPIYHKQKLQTEIQEEKRA